VEGNVSDCPTGQGLLLVGPSPYFKKIGGVARHMQVLSNLALSQGATYFDPGSTNGKMTWGVIGAFLGAFGVWKVARRIGARQVWINTSIYPFAFLKLLIILTGMRLASEIKVRVFFHGGRFETIAYLKGKAFRKCCSAILRRTSMFHFLSREQGMGFSKAFPACEWGLFSNFIPESTLLPKHPSKIKAFLFVGRLVKEKGVREVVMAIESLLTYGVCLDGIEFWFAGDGPELDMLREATSRFPVGIIRTLGVLGSEELDSVYQSAQVLLLPSYSEGFPYVVIEAMRAGLPIICTPTGALADLIKPKENGLVVQIGDAAGLADAVRTFVFDEALVKRISENNAQLFLEQLSKKAADEFYGRLLNEP